MDAVNVFNVVINFGMMVMSIRMRNYGIASWNTIVAGMFLAWMWFRPKFYRRAELKLDYLLAQKRMAELSLEAMERAVRNNEVGFTVSRNDDDGRVN